MTDTTPDFSRYLNVRSAYAPSFTHDGEALAFLTDVSGVAEAWRVHLPAGAAAPLWPDQLTFSGDRISRMEYAPNDNRLLLCGDADGSELTQLYLLSPDGADLRHIAGAPNAICQFGAWSPDGQRIVYASNERDARFFDIYERDMTTGDTRAYPLPDGTYWPERYSPDGASIVIARYETFFRNQLILLDRASGVARPLTPDPTAAHAAYANPAWSADGQSLYLLSDEGQDHRQFAMLDLSSGAMRSLTDAPWDAEALAVSRDGARLALVTNEDGYSRLTVYDVAAGWEQRRALTTPTWDHACWVSFRGRMMASALPSRASHPLRRSTCGRSMSPLAR